MATAPRQRKKLNASRAESISRASTSGVVAADYADTPNVAYLRTDLAFMLPTYHLIRDCLLGERIIKQHDRGGALGQRTVLFGAAEYVASNLYGYSTITYETRYLPKPNPTNNSVENNERYQQYVMRAVFYNFTARTLSGLIGAVFLRAPVIEVPDALEFIEADATGGGVSLVQLAKQACKLVVAYGRAGLLADYPEATGPVTVADKLAGVMRTTLSLYAPWTVINWREAWRGGKQQLVLVVIAETGVMDDDGFKETTCEQYRVLQLLPNGVYQSAVWRRDGSVESPLVQFAVTVPTDAAGRPFDHIPFTFVGPEDNGTSVDNAPMSDLAGLNIAHYRNSADYEESSYLTGQPTPVFTGLTEQWVENVLEGTVSLGSRAAVMLPVDATATLMQAAPNSIPLEGMRHKETQAISLGARLIEEKRTQRTATQTNIDDASSKSILATAAANVSQAILWALKEACAFEGLAYDDTTLKFEINTELDLVSLAPEARKQLLSEWQSGAITFSEYRHNLQRSGITQLDVDDALKELKETPPPINAALELEAVRKQATNDRIQP